MAGIPSTTENPNGVATGSGLAATAQDMVGDAVELLKLQLAMFKAETLAALTRLRAGAICLACSIGPLVLGCVLLGFGLVHLLHWSTVPADSALADPATLPLWACYALVAGGCLLMGGTLLAFGVYYVKTVNLLAPESTRALEENIQWLLHKTPR